MSISAVLLSVLIALVLGVIGALVTGSVVPALAVAGVGALVGVVASMLPADPDGGRHGR